MRTHTPLFLLAALGLLPATEAAAADTTQWKCTACPFPKGTTGSVDAGVGYVSQDSTTFGDYTGLYKKGPYLDLGGTLTYRGDDGYFADASAANLGIETRSLDAQAGREGKYSFRLGYAEIPRYFAEGARTPFQGNGGNVLSLPAGVGFPAGTTALMPLATTLAPVDLGYLAKRLDLSGTWIGDQNLTYRASYRRDVRDGTTLTAGSFNSTTSQLASPVDYATDQFELAAAYATPRLQATLAYQVSLFSNANPSLTWTNPFTPVAGATQGQLALSPDNQFHQIVGSAGYQISPTVRASADLAIGRMTQNAPYLASTVNPNLAPMVPALPSASLDGLANTVNFNVKLSATPMDGLRLSAIYAYDARDNQTAVQSYPMVSTDMFLVPTQTSNTPFDLAQNRLKLLADYRGPNTWKFSGGFDFDHRERTYAAAVSTNESTIWGRASVQAVENLGLTFNLAYGDRQPSTYGVAYWFPPENPLSRNYNLAARKRTTAGARGDWAVTPGVSLGLGADYAYDSYYQTPIGLQDAETISLAADVTTALSEATSIRAYWQGERMNSVQTGSQNFSSPDWTGKVNDTFQVLGMGVKHLAIPDKLDLAADLIFTHSDSDTSVQTGVGEPPFPTASTSLQSLRLLANYHLKDNLTLIGSYWYQHYDSADWRLDGVNPNTVPNLLAFGNQSPSYNVNVFRVSMRYNF